MTNPVMLTVSSITPIHAEPAVLEVHMSRAMTVAEINTLFERLNMALMASAAEPEAPARFAECDSCERLYANHMAGKRCHQMLVTGEICKGTIMTKL